MKNSRFRIQAAALTFIMLPAAAGVVAVRASATCQRFVKTYITKPVRNRVSKTTAEAWAQWRIAHPNWKPNPKLHRPKYIMTREESMQKVEFACSVPVIDRTIAALFSADVPPPIVNFKPREATEITFPDEIPPEIAEVTPEDSWPPLAPYVPPILNSTPGAPGGPPVFPIIPPNQDVPLAGPVAEPASLLLVGTGMAFLGVLLAAFVRRESDTAQREFTS